jgi:cytosine/uracil/thiamine/allantoin permease
MNRAVTINNIRELMAIFHFSRFARAGGSGFENLLTQASRPSRASKTMNASPARTTRTLMANGL